MTDKVLIDRAALEQSQVEQEPAAWMVVEWSGTGMRHLTFDEPPTTPSVRDEVVKPVWTPLYTHPQNLNCKSTQARLATLWGYEKPQPPRQPLTAEQIAYIEDMFSNEFGLEAKHAVDFARAIERAHGIIGE